ncbi:MAG: hypothetical protein K2N22_06055 [Clostridia bacterium]|nr:hypothetical protein [Clostridia bacterium]
MSVNFPAVKTKTVNLADMTVFPVSCRVSGNEVVPALSAVYKGGGLDGIKKAAYSKGVKLYLLFADETLYVSESGVNFSPILDTGEKTPFVMDVLKDGTPCAALVFGGNATLLTAAGFGGVTLGENIKAGVMHCGRLFGVSSDGLRVCWSKCGIDDWTQELNGGGSIYLGADRGAILGILEFGENLVAVRERGLTLLAMYGSPENFSVKLTDTDTDEIIPDTAKVAGGTLYFCTKTGVCAFDGGYIKRVPHRFESEIEECYFAESYAGGYYLSCKTESFGKVILCIGQDGESYIIDVGADAVCVSDKLYIYSADGIYVLENGGEYLVISEWIDFGTGANKTVTEVYANSENCAVEISNGVSVRTFEGVNGAVRPRLRGKKFNLKISGKERLKSLTLTAEVSVGI